MKKSKILKLVAVLIFVLSGADKVFSQQNFASYIVFNPWKDEVYSTLKPQLLWRPASLTKIMTLYIVLEGIQKGNISLNSTFKMTRLGARQPPSKMFLSIGTKLSVANAIYMVAVKSANDVTTSLAQFYSGSVKSFVDKMNMVAKHLGMKNTKFVGPSGLKAANFTTAGDMALLIQAFVKKYPEFLHIFSFKSFVFKGKYYYSANPLLAKYKGANGFKTGFICAAGYNIVASAVRRNKATFVVGFGASSPMIRFLAASNLLDSGFNATNSMGGLSDYSFTTKSYKITNFSSKACSEKVYKDPVVRNRDSNILYLYGVREPLIFVGNKMNIAFPQDVILPSLRPSKDRKK